MLAFAFLGGLILNLMPCVFPILAIKAVAVAKLSGHERGSVRAQALSYTLGVLFAFAGLGVSLLVFRTAGSFAGWGFQFQSPVFVTAMAFLFTARGLEPFRRVRDRRRLRQRGRQLRGARRGRSAVSSPGFSPCSWRRLARLPSWERRSRRP